MQYHIFNSFLKLKIDGGKSVGHQTLNSRVAEKVVPCLCGDGQQRGFLLDSSNQNVGRRWPPAYTTANGQASLQRW